MPELHEIRNRLRARPPAPVEPFTGQRAAVAVLLREHAGTTEALFIKRADRAGDPWSGHMAFPGGRAEPRDADLQATAVRETLEEIGFNISLHARPIAPIPPTHAAPRDEPRKLLVAPFAFELEGDPLLSPNHEVADCIWAPLAPMMDGHTLTTYPWDGPAGQSHFPGYALDRGYIVWGLTYRLLHNLFELVRPDWQPPPEDPTGALRPNA